MHVYIPNEKSIRIGTDLEWRTPQSDALDNLFQKVGLVLHGDMTLKGSDLGMFVALAYRLSDQQIVETGLDTETLHRMLAEIQKLSLQSEVRLRKYEWYGSQCVGRRLF